MMAAGVISLLAAVLLFYKWLLRRGITSRLSFLTALHFFIVRTDDLSFLQSDYVCQLYAVFVSGIFRCRSVF